MDKLPPSNGDACSDAAADSMVEHAAAIRQRIWMWLWLYGPHTCDELEILLDLKHQTCSARCTELRRMGDVIRRGKRKTRSGRMAWTLEATQTKATPPTPPWAAA